MPEGPWVLVELIFALRVRIEWKDSPWIGELVGLVLTKEPLSKIGQEWRLKDLSLRFYVLNP
jgi:hypothetical protein